MRVFHKSILFFVLSNIWEIRDQIFKLFRAVFCFVAFLLSQIDIKTKCILDARMWKINFCWKLNFDLYISNLKAEILSLQQKKISNSFLTAMLMFPKQVHCHKMGNMIQFSSSYYHRLHLYVTWICKLKGC